MPQISPFRGLRFDAQRVGDVGAALCPPYDVISPREQAQLQEASSYNIVQVELSADRPGDGEQENRYTRAADLVAAWRGEGALVEESAPAYYFLEHTFTWAGQEFTRFGVFAAVLLQPWADGAVLPHEATFSGPKEDRYRLLRATNLNVSPVFMVYREQPPALERAWQSVLGTTPTMDVVLGGERQRLWVLDDPASVLAIQRELASQTLYIADGHHRYETALRYRDERVASDAVGSDHPACSVLAYIVPMRDPGLVVLPTHRMVRGVDPDAVRALLESYGQAIETKMLPLNDDAALVRVQPELEALGAGRPAFGVIAGDGSTVSLYSVVDPSVMANAAPSEPEPWRSLDVSALQALVLDKLLPTHHERDASITYTRDPEAARQAVIKGECQVAFIMNTPSVEGMANVADARARMPEKSTYFYPKVSTGVVMRSTAR